MEPGYTLSELCDLAGVSPRTVRYYVAEGLLRTPGQGSRVRYGEDHLARLRLIRRLQREHLPLAEIRNRMRGLTDDDVRSVASAPAGDPAPGSAIDYVRTVLAGRGVSGRGASPAAAPAAASQPSPASPAAPVPGRADRVAAVARIASIVPTPVAPGQRATASGSANVTSAAGSAPPVPSARAEPVPLAAHPAAEPLPEPERSQWDRIALAPDLELHVRRPLSRLANRQLARLLDAARDILREEQP